MEVLCCGIESVVAHVSKWLPLLGSSFTFMSQSISVLLCLRQENWRLKARTLIICSRFYSNAEYSKRFESVGIELAMDTGGT
eukprot:5716267-Amphidinium_carterae.1